MDISLKQLNNITDLYKDRTTFYQVLERPERPAIGVFKPGLTFSTASPFCDSIVKLLLKLEIDDKVEYDNYDGVKEPVMYELEDYFMPAVLRRVLKLSKLNEKVEIKSKLEYKLLDHISDTKNEIFVIDKMKDFKSEIKITFTLLEIISKDHILKVPVEERL